MSNQRVKFPDDFWWGVAGAAHQVEGGNVNSDSWVLEHVPESPYAEPSGDACDHYHRYPEDIAQVAALGFNTYRFSIEWARIEPEEGEFSIAALEHYRRMLAACHEHGLRPIVTYHHFTSPRWFAAKGGFEVPANADTFGRYCERATTHLGDLIGAVCTLNELNLGALFKHFGVDHADPKLQQARAAAAKAVGSDRFSQFPFACDPGTSLDTLLKAHRLGRDAIKSKRADLPVGMTLALVDHQAAPGGEALRDQMRAGTDGVCLDVAKQGDDFIGVQTYSRILIGPEGVLPVPDGAEVTQMDYEFYPESLENTIRYAAGYTGLPVIVTENGIGTTDDTRRVEYVRRALIGVHNCLQDGIKVNGYCYWSIFDNFEWTLGYRPTYGLIAVDRTTQVRTPKPSAAFLGNIAKSGELSA